MGMMHMALYLADLGWPVIPLASGEKTPVTARGFNDASRDPVQIERWWWGGERDYNIGIALPEGMCCIDCDSSENWDVFRGLLGQAAEDAVRCKTPRGMHIYYRGVPEGLTQTQNAIGPGVDLRIGGISYLVAPGSVRPDGAYEFAGPRWFEPSKVTPLPDIPVPLPTVRPPKPGKPGDGEIINRGQVIGLFATCSERGIPEETLRAVVGRVSGQRSTRKLNQEQYKEVRAELIRASQPVSA